MPEEKFYRVEEPDKKICPCGCCTPVYTADMDEDGGWVPLFFVNTEHKAQLAAELLGWSPEELQAARESVDDYREGLEA